MRIKANPFMVLETQPDSSLARIEEATDNKSFMEEENQARYEEARSTLTYPQKRIEAEVRWFYSDPDAMTAVASSPLDDLGEQFSLSHREAALYCAEKLYQFAETQFDKQSDKSGLVTLAAKLVKRMDNGYFRAFDPDEMEDLEDEINAARAAAGFPAADAATIADHLRNALDEDITASLKHFVDTNEINVITSVVREIVKEQIAVNGDRSSKRYHEVIIRLLDLYNVKVNDTLDSLKNDIEAEIENAIGYGQAAQLEPLFGMVRKLEYYAEPLQLYFRDIGQAGKQKQSQDVAYDLRDLAVTLSNDKNLPQMSLAIARFESQVFYAIPELVEKLKDDIATLAFMVKTQNFFKLVNSVRDEVSHLVVRENGHEVENKRNILGNKDKWLAALNQAAEMVPGAGEAHAKEMNSVMSSIFYTLATACTWGELWDLALEIARKGQSFARASGNLENIRAYQKAIKEFMASVQYENQKKEESSKGLKKMLVILGSIIVIVFLLWAGSSNSSHKNTNAGYKKSKPPISSSQQVNEEKPVTEKTENAIEYQEPPVGSGRRFTMAEMHWAAREQVRLDTMKPLIKTDAGIRAYNKMVNNYNSRASSFKYRHNDWQVAKNDVEKHRSEIVAEAEEEVRSHGWDKEETWSGAVNPLPSRNQSLKSDTPSDTFRNFHTDITNRDYQSAWNCLSPDFQAGLSYDKWVAGYKETIQSTPVRVSVMYNNGQTARLSFRVRALEKDKMTGSNVTSFYEGEYTLIRIGSEWKISSASQRQVP